VDDEQEKSSGNPSLTTPIPDDPDQRVNQVNLLFWRM
jgi:hypothetical protein